jgi:hypothetical protein
VVAACFDGAPGRRRGVEDRRRGFGSAQAFLWRWPLGERARKTVAQRGGRGGSSRPGWMATIKTETATCSQSVSRAF